ncbi:glucose-6-phosphate isomerase [Actinomadura parmotrematis]|uniref:Glucose-6-phosphate isomerase n=1 Tax=Actinomadura parmotrematis TaxID=2864039 RepID=A0ABS7FUK4_9ACTN|nr:glucose-6-phosphate isomerase [Actinomadura parmotrematis]MBW8483267.1 glucose-6-phosphate isomerase [Actinomadura parmotrematis]
MTSVVTAGGVSVTVRGSAVEEGETVLDRLVGDGAPRSLAAGTTTLWGPDAAPLAARRLGWLGLPESARPLARRLAGRAGAARGAGLDRVVLIAVGGPAAAAEVIARSAGAPLTVLDSTDPQRAAAVLAEAPARTLVVVADKAGDSLEVDALRRVAERALWEAGVGDPAARFVVVTDPGTPLEALAADSGYEVEHTDPETGDRFAALDASALVPAALAGVDVTRLLDEAAALLPALAQPYDNPPLVLGAALASSALAGRDKVVLADQGSGLPGLGSWVEQLLSGALGKDGRGVLPVALDDVDDPGFELTPGMRRIVLGSRPDEPGAGREAGASVAGPLGAQFLMWEYAAAIAARVLGVNPFDAPNTAESADSALALLRPEEGAAPTVIVRPPLLAFGAVQVHGPDDLLDGAKELPDVLDALLDAAPDDGYLAVLAYLDRHGDAPVAALRARLASRARRIRRNAVPVTFGWAPQALHGAGQFHKGGPQTGVFLQLTGDTEAELPVPGRPYSLRELQLAQAFGDLRVLRSRGRPAVRLHLTDRAAGIRQLLDALPE